MDAKNSVVVSFSLYEYGGPPGIDPHPREIIDLVKPEPIKKVWVAQTIYDAIWVFYEFKNPQERQEFLDSPPKVFSKAKIHLMDQQFFDKWVKDIE